LFILALTLHSLAMIGAYYVLPLDDATRSIIYYGDLLLCVVFLGDAIRALVCAPDQRTYLKWGWLDFVGSIPFFLPLRLARLHRLGRAWRVVQAKGWRYILHEFQGRRARGSLLILGFLVIVLLTTASIAVLEIESGAPKANIATGEDAFWWAIVTATTVGYGDHYPVTLWGRLVAVGLMVLGIGTVSVLTSGLAARFLVRSSSGQDEAAEADQESPGAPQDELRALRSSVDALGEQAGGILERLEALDARLAAIERSLRLPDHDPGEPDP
jgi:voltage-gated potassium channel